MQLVFVIRGVMTAKQVAKDAARERPRGMAVRRHVAGHVNGCRDDGGRVSSRSMR